MLKFYLDGNDRIYVLEDDEWEVKGCLDKAVEKNDKIQWDNNGGKYTLSILCVSFKVYIFLASFLLTYI